MKFCCWKLLFGLLACVLHFDQSVAKVAVATFYNDGVSGTMTFSQEAIDSAVIITLDISGLDKKAGAYHVHTFPVSVDPVASGYQLNSYTTGCSASIVGGHFNPLLVPGGADVPGEYKCGNSGRLLGESLRSGEFRRNLLASNLSLCESGDLSGKFGSLNDISDIQAEFTDFGSGLNLFGEHSIVGRSVVIHTKSGDRWLCATILEENLQLKQIVIHLNNSLVFGTVSFFQNLFNESAESCISVRLKSKASNVQNLGWSIAQLAAGQNIHEEIISCASGDIRLDLAESHGNLVLQPNSYSTYFFTNSELKLTGTNSLASNLFKLGSTCALITKEAVSTVQTSTRKVFASFVQASQYDVLAFYLSDITNLNSVKLCNYPVTDIPDCNCSSFYSANNLLNGLPSGISLFGENSVLFRSLLFEYNTGIKLCSNIIYKRFAHNTLVANFSSSSSNLSGNMFFYQNALDSASLTSIYSKIAYSNMLNSTFQHKWHVHQNKLASKTSSCDTAGGHFNPSKLNGGAEVSSNFAYRCSVSMAYCELGDIVGKTGPLSIPSENFFAAVDNLNLGSISERSVVIHGSQGSADRLSCTNLLPLGEILEEGGNNGDTNPTSEKSNKNDDEAIKVVVPLVLVLTLLGTLVLLFLCIRR